MRLSVAIKFGIREKEKGIHTHTYIHMTLIFLVRKITIIIMVINLIRMAITTIIMAITTILITVKIITRTTTTKNKNNYYDNHINNYNDIDINNNNKNKNKNNTIRSLVSLLLKTHTIKPVALKHPRIPRLLVTITNLTDPG